MKRRNVIGVIVTGVIGLLAISGTVISAVNTYVAPLSTGEIRVAGLGTDVEITRNEIGVPHIRAASFNDALFLVWAMPMPKIGSGRWR